MSFDLPQLACEQAYLLPLNQQCEFVQSKCLDTPGFINPFTVYYCLQQTTDLRHWLCMPLLLVLMISMFVCIGFVSGDCLIPNLNAIASYLNIPENISGLTLLAFANGSPDIISTYTSFATGNISLAFGEIVGAAYFVNSVVIGLVFIIRPFDLLPYSIQNTDINNNNENSGALEDEETLIKWNAKGSYLRDVCFFIFSAFILLCCIRDGILSRAEMLLLVTIYVTYVLSIIVFEWYFKRRLNKIRIINRARNLYDGNPLALIIGNNDVEHEDSYIYNPNLIKNLEFQSILGGASRRRNFRYDWNHSAMYMDEERNQQNVRLNDGDDSSIDISFPTKTFLEKTVDYISFPFVKLFRHTVPILILDTNEETFKPSLATLSELLTSLMISPLIIVHTMFSSRSFFIKLLIAFPIVGLTYFIYHNLVKSGKPSIQTKIFIAVLGVITSVSWISIIAAEIISILTLISSLTYIHESALGLTIFALGNSVGDLISCIVISKMGYPLMALAACLGGPLFNLLMGLGMNGLFLGTSQIEIPTSISIKLCLFGLLVNLITVLLVFIPWGGWRCDKYAGISMIILWAVFVSVSIVLELLV